MQSAKCKMEGGLNLPLVSWHSHDPLRLSICLIVCLAAGGAEVRFVSLEHWDRSALLLATACLLVSLLMALAAWRIWRRVIPAPQVRWALVAFVVQLLLGLCSLSGGWAILAVYWLVMGWTVYLFARLSRPAAALMLPAWAWITFLAALNR
jgi:tryptophan-rich sensory protein